MALTYEEIEAWRDKEKQRLSDIKDDRAYDYTKTVINILTAVLQDD